MGEPALREPGGPQAVGDRLRRRRRGGRAHVVVGQRGDVVRGEPLQADRDPAVHPRGAQPTEVRQQGVAHQCVGEPDPPRLGFGQQPGEQTGFQRAQYAVLVGVRRPDQDLDAGLPSGHRGQAQYGHHCLGEASEPPAQHVPYALGHLGQRHQRALAAQQPGALLDVEGVPSRAFGQRGHDLRVDLRAAHAPDHLGHGLLGEAAQRDPGR